MSSSSREQAPSKTPAWSNPSGSGLPIDDSAAPASVPPVQGTADDLNRSAMLRVVCEAQRLRWHEGQRLQVEQCLLQYPALQVDDEGILDLVYNEVVLREEQGERPQLDEYLERFPQYTSELRHQFSLHVALFQQSGSFAPANDTPASAGSSATPSGTPPLSDGTPAPGSQTPVDSEGMPLTVSVQNPVTPSQVPTLSHALVSPSKMPTLDQPLPADAKKAGKQPIKPDNIPGYEILGTLGRGGMGVVYRARQIGLKREVALKMVLARGHASPEQLDRFRGEAEAIAKLQHPNIVQVYDVGEDSGKPYFSLEFVKGGALDKKLAGTPQDTQWSAQMTETLARAMHAAHLVGIVHRDLKPANVLLTVSQEPKITDFGLAKQLEEESGQTHEGQIMGTPSYMAPEQAKGRVSDIGPATDVYALGAILYEFLTGRPPFKAGSPWDTVRQVQTDDPIPPSRLRPRLPRDLETICLKCLEKPVAKRYPTAEELADDLRRYLNGEPVKARRTPPWERAWKFALRRKALTFALGAVVFAVIASFVVILLQLRYEKQQREFVEKNATRLSDVAGLVGAAERANETAVKLLDYQPVLVLVDQAVKRAGGEPLTPELQTKIDNLYKSARRGHDYRKRLSTFRQHHDRAMLYETGVTGHKREDNFKIMKDAALKGLAVYQVALDNSAQPDAPKQYYSEQELQEIREGCYELLIILANTEAEPVAGEGQEDRAKRLEEAMRYLDRSKDLGITTKVEYVLRASYLDRLGRRGSASMVRKEMPKESQGALDNYRSGMALHDLVKSMMQKDLMKEAQSFFHQAVRAQPNHFWSHYLLALEHMRLGNSELAEMHLHVGRNLNPELLWIHINLGLVHAELGYKAITGEASGLNKAQRYWQLAHADYEEALARVRDDETLRYAILNNRAGLRIRMGAIDPPQYDQALPDLDQAIQLRPKQLQAYFLLGQVYQQTGKLDQAIQQFKTALEIEPRYLEGHRTLYQAHLQKGDYEAGLKDIENAIAHHPKGVKADDLAEDHVQRGELLRRFRKLPEAVAAFDTALTVQKDYAKAYRYKGMALFEQGELGKGNIEEQKKSYDGAIKALNEYLQRDKPEANLFLVRGLAKAKLSNFLGAVDDYTRALELPFDRSTETPVQPELQVHPAAATHVQRGILYLIALDAPKLAERDFEEAITLNPKIGPEAYVGRGLCEVQVKGDYKKATATAEHALQETEKRGAENAFVVYNVARIYSLALGRVDLEINARKADPRYDLRPLGSLRLGYVKQALKNLNQSMEKMTVPQRKNFFAKTVMQDRAFLPLKTEAPFRQMAEVYLK